MRPTTRATTCEGAGAPAGVPASAASSIRTPDQRIRVFVSSTLTDLIAERRGVRTAVERLHMVPVMFELGARPHPPGAVYRAYLRQSHVFVGIYHERYGWVAPGEQISGLEDEFRLSAGLPRLLYLKRPRNAVDPRLQAMLEEFRHDATASYRVFEDARELESLVEEDLAVLVNGSFMDTWAGEPEHRPAGRPGTTPPVPLTATIGRDVDIAAIAARLRGDGRLVTIVGPGGVGKSRVALEVARVVSGDFEHGVVFVPLESVPEPGRVLRTIAERLGVADSGTRPVLDALAQELSTRRVLLIIDNFEQVTRAAPDLAELLGRCPGLVVLVTSRHALRVRGEREYHLPPLPVPGDPSPVGVSSDPAALTLFVQRAQAANPGFRLTPANRPALERIVQLLDGLPLAIELAAPRVRMLAPAALLERLTQRLDLLSAGAGDLPPRQRALRSTLDWSFQLLDPGERALFTRLSVFAGGATLEAVETVAGDGEVPDVLATVSSLAQKSLVETTVEASDGAARIRMLQTVRSRAAELLAERGEGEQIAARHARWYADFAEPGDVLRHGDAPGHWHLLETELDNLRAAASWAIEHADGPLLLDLARRLWPWLWISGRVGELLTAVSAAQTAASGAAMQAPVHGYLSYVESYARALTGDFTGGLAAAEVAVGMLEGCDDGEQQLVVAAARLARGTLRGALHRDGGEADISAAVTAARVAGNPWLLGYATSHRGLARAMAGDLAGARADHGESLAAATAMGHEVLLAQAVGQLAIVDVLEGHLDEALEGLERQIGLLRHSRNLEGLANALDDRGGPRALGHRSGRRERRGRSARADRDVALATHRRLARGDPGHGRPRGG